MPNTLKNFPKYRLELLDKGYTVGRGIIPKETIASIRRLGAIHSQLGGIHKHNGVRQPHAFRKAPFIAQIFKANSLVQLIAECLDSDEWFLTNHADLHTNALSGWHKDDGMSYGGGGYFKRAAYDLVNPKVFKIAIYFQDHVDFNDGLTIIPGSHRTSAIRSGNELHLNTQVGDVIVFDVRLSHTGQLNPIPRPLTKHAKKTIAKIKNRIDQINKKSIPKYDKQTELLQLFRSRAGGRSSIFFTVAVESASSNTFAITNMERQIDELDPNTTAFLPVSVIGLLREFGVQSIDSKDFWKERFKVQTI